jgi:hypothetical protein
MAKIIDKWLCEGHKTGQYCRRRLKSEIGSAEGHLQNAHNFSFGKEIWLLSDIAATVLLGLVGTALSGIPYQHITPCYRVPTSPKRLYFPGTIGIAPRHIWIPVAIGGAVLEGPICSLTNAHDMACESSRITAVVVRYPGFSLLVQIRQVSLVVIVIVHDVCLSDGLGKQHHMHAVAMGEIYTNSALGLP